MLELGHARGLCREQSGGCSWARGTGTPAAAGGGQGGAALPQGLAQQGRLDQVWIFCCSSLQEEGLWVSALFALAGPPVVLTPPSHNHRGPCWLHPAYAGLQGDRWQHGSPGLSGTVTQTSGRMQIEVNYLTL